MLETSSRLLELLSRVDPEGDVIHEDGIDAQASLEGAELLQSLSPLQG